MDLVQRVLSGDRRAMARLMTMVENGSPDVREALSQLHRHTGSAHVIGITGPPGSGKSTVVDKLTVEYLKRGRTIGIIAVDPTSPFTGGALLGDRIRMNEVALNKEVFIRSMGTRGHLGGIAVATSDLIKIMDAFGKDLVIVETVGAGQSEVDIVRSAHTTVIVEVPGLGDDIQAIKAGILEIGDIFVVNKADREGVDRTVGELGAMLEMSSQVGGWKPPILKAVARDGVGIVEVADAIEDHMTHLRDTRALEKKLKDRTRTELLDIVKEDLSRKVVEKALTEWELEDLVLRIMNREEDPYSAAERILARLENGK